MNFFSKLFKKKASAETPPMPAWETVVEMMHDQQLNFIANEVMEVIYSIDGTMRYVILKDERGFFTYHLEALRQFDEDEWIYFGSQDNALPAAWDSFGGIKRISLFDTIEALKKELQAEPEYNQYFR